MNRLIKVFALILLIGCGFVFPHKSFGKKGSVKIAMAQIFCLDGDRSGNFVRIENALKDATDQGAEIVTFPETSILGWINPDAHERAFPIPGEDSDKLCALAKKYDVFINIGLAEKDGDKLYDSVILIDNEGKILLKHRKINILTDLMTPSYTKGNWNDVKSVDTKLGKIGVLICADTFMDSLLLKFKNQHIDLLLVPYGWAAEETAWPEHAKELEKIVNHTANYIGCPVVGTDLVGEISHGPWKGMVYGGQSIAIDQNGKILAKARDRDYETVVFTINFLTNNE